MVYLNNLSGWHALCCFAGIGSYGEVWKAVHDASGETVAIKISPLLHAAESKEIAGKCAKCACRVRVMSAKCLLDLERFVLGLLFTPFSSLSHNPFSSFSHTYFLRQ
jgi:hypothetical protein